ncbi:Rli1p and Yae1p interacting protein [Komagataella phaffii CBS 7435]|uniref:Essential protein Yae1 N-terminal domain-containing protein n=2 Tax=Komagataella phaffii TaxID=460519 RepID=C4QV68_KOMPG|nr:uncharacterized protein PAS_chr1-3_0295 [Komagataella phaffii GS115]AOA61541.1 GQ67_02337T0 [Komagataella phaffii]CAH2445793.1 Rli1p and Yae1p interacting protein [Komagataella phaffii CBS 7435]AOA66774.1 GQ68_02910T0 [Komagataella phaffii GS115]CAY67141.1 hypothetical protein PAS_chr1-3_0295 [Komagataella phaffii GS115]CCA36250.1 Rli1p and Yae1p interacting protein [Komagataella phaffii CBS 7435]
MDDPFESVLSLEQQFYQDGYNEGYQKGVETHFKEGKEYGVQTGFQKFVFLGFIQGFTKNILASDQENVKVKENALQIESILEPLQDHTSNSDADHELLESALKKCRNKLRVICNQMQHKTSLSQMENLCLDITGKIPGEILEDAW